MVQQNELSQILICEKRLFGEDFRCAQSSYLFESKLKISNWVGFQNASAGVLLDTPRGGCREFKNDDFAFASKEKIKMSDNKHRCLFMLIERINLIR